MIQLDQHEGSYLSICKHYRAIYDTPCIQAESEKWQQVRIYSYTGRQYLLGRICNFYFEISLTSVIVSSCMVLLSIQCVDNSVYLY